MLGLRKLEPLGILPVKRPYIFFDVNSIMMPNSKSSDVHQVKSIKTEPNSSGSDPTINTTIAFEVDLPIERIFVPTMLCMVYDKVLFGIGNDLLGVFTFDVSNLISLTHLQLQEDTAITAKKVGLVALQDVLGLGFDNMSILNESRLESQSDAGSEVPFEKQETQEKGLVSDISTSRIDRPLIEHDESNAENAIQTDPDKKSQGYNNLAEEKDKKKDKGKKNLNDSKEEPLMKKDEKEKGAELKHMSFVKNLKQTSKVKRKEEHLAKRQEAERKSISNLLENNLISEKHSSFLTHECKVHKSEIVQYPKWTEISVPGQKKVYMVEDKSKIPSPDLYIGLGHENPNQESCISKKHYRRYYRCPLEDEPSLDIESPFIKIPIHRDRFVDKSNKADIFEKMKSKNKILKRFKLNAGDDNEETAEEQIVQKEVKKKEYGYFKGLIKILDSEKRTDFMNMLEKLKTTHPNIIQDFKNWNKYQDITKKILIKQEVIVRIYVLELRDLAKRDLTSESDPFLKIRLGKNLIDDSAKHLDDAANARIYRHFE